MIIRGNTITGLFNQSGRNFFLPVGTIPYVIIENNIIKKTDTELRYMAEVQIFTSTTILLTATIFRALLHSEEAELILTVQLNTNFGSYKEI